MNILESTIMFTSCSHLVSWN